MGEWAMATSFAYWPKTKLANREEHNLWPLNFCPPASLVLASSQAAIFSGGLSTFLSGDDGQVKSSLTRANRRVEGGFALFSDDDKRSSLATRGSR